jgi:hypothetical protein
MKKQEEIMKHRYLCLLLALAMAFTCIPGSLLAEEDVNAMEETMAEEPISVSDDDSGTGSAESDDSASATDPISEETEDEVSTSSEKETEDEVSTSSENESVNETGVVPESENEPVSTDDSDSTIPVKTEELETVPDEDAEQVEEPALTEEPVEEKETEPEFVVEDGILKKYNGTDEIVTIPDDIRVIDTKAFSNNKNIKKIIVPDSVEIIEDYAFEDCSELTEIEISETSKLETIGEGAFKNDAKLDVSFAENVPNIADDAFEGAGINNQEQDESENVLVEEPASTDNADSADDASAAATEGQESVTDENAEQTEELAPTEEPIDNPEEEKEFEIEEDTLKSYNGTDEIVTVPNGIRVIDTKALSNKKGIKKVILPDSVEIIGNYAFEECSNLTEIEIADTSKLETIGKGAFINDTKLDISFAENVQNIMETAFDGAGVDYQESEELAEQDADTKESTEETDEVLIDRMLTGEEDCKIVTPPSDWIVKELGEQAEFTVVATGVKSIQWQVKGKSGSWSTKSTGLDYTYTSTVTQDKIDMPYEYRCKVTFTDGTSSDWTKAVKMVMPAQEVCEIVTPPSDWIVKELGETAEFTVVATGVESIQWQVKGKNGSWSTKSTGLDYTYTSTVTQDKIDMPYEYRCKVIFTDGTNSGWTEAVKMVMADPTFVVDNVRYRILEDPTTVTVEKYLGTAASVIIPENPKNPADQTVKYTVVAIGAEAFMDNTTLASIDLPDTVAVIGARAFKGCTSLAEMH